MKTQSKTKRIQPGYEPIKGYVLEKLIGRGGYGEVWRAEAPGGLKKAVKFVFGQHDERRAEQELKSLERIKGIQHPFILTLERFELIENQLVIVTELADGSLEDVFKQHRERGSCGIPRDALISYMKDSADALDYLHKFYKLQHLDIKPANLLMVGGRVKVADFGLLKDLSEVECSLVGGLTPIYAPPEVFDGRPSMHSDQYSLAIMYQELLTSTRPFMGRTIAQLATQHVHNAPNLNPLPASDRPSVARALEKSPERRFSSCSEFVEKLLSPHGRPIADVEADVDEMPKIEAHRVENLPQLRAVAGLENEIKQTQALVIALGGTGSDCLHQLRSRIFELGAASPMTLHSVLIDTDLVVTQTAAMIDGSDFVPRCRIVNARLRRPKDYRDSGTDRLKTISRRWIYNVPRNAMTGGMRPLGRLALVDHGSEVLSTLRAAVIQLKDTLTAGTHPKVYVVGSLTGGSGSGMYIDVVHLLRHLMDESAMENEPILSLLTTNKFQGDPSRPLALHNTKSAMRELAHFLKPGNGYPGDEGAGWPSVPAARTPLHNTYLVAASERTNSPKPVDSVVNYLWSDATLCGEIFEQGRSAEGEQKDSSVSLPCIRSLSVVQIGDPSERQSSLLAPYSTKQLLLRWLGSPKTSKTPANEFCERIQRRCYLELEPLIEQTERWWGSDRMVRREALMEQLKTVERGLLSNDGLVRSHLVKWLTNSIDLERADLVADQIKQQISREIRVRIEDGRLNLSATLVGLTTLRTHIKSLYQRLMENSNDEEPLPPLGDGKHTETASKGESRFSLLGGRGDLTSLRRACDLGEQLIRSVSGRVAAAIVISLEDLLVELTEAYSDASTVIAQSIQSLSEDAGWAQDPWGAMEKPIQRQLPRILDRLHAENVNSWLFKIVHTPASVSTDVLISQLISASTATIREHIGDLSTKDPQAGIDTDSRTMDRTKTISLESELPTSVATDSLTTGRTTYLTSRFEPVEVSQTYSWSVAEPAPALTVQAAFAAVRPPLLECGGKQRLYLICRDKTEQEKLEMEFPDADDLQFTTILARSSMPMLVHEAQSIELKNVIAWLDSLTGDDGKISGRLNTRSDVIWS